MLSIKIKLFSLIHERSSGELIKFPHPLVAHPFFAFLRKLSQQVACYRQLSGALYGALDQHHVSYYSLAIISLN